MPPENIAPGSSETIFVQADSSYLFTGLEGWVVYCTKSVSSPPHVPKNILKRTRSDRLFSNEEKNHSLVKPIVGNNGPKPKQLAEGVPEKTSDRTVLTGSGKSILKRSRSYSVDDAPTLTFNNMNHNNIEINVNNLNLNNGLLMDEEGQIIHIKNVTFAPEELAKGVKENYKVLTEPKRMINRPLAKSSPANLTIVEKNPGAY